MFLPLYAFGFTSLPMLGWLAAAAAPILIHLWSRRRYREMSWAAMEYLLAAIQRHTRRLLFEQWLLLLLRTLLVVLLALAVAGPYWEGAVSIFTADGKTHRILVIDASFSMAYKPTEQSRFDRAKEIARQMIEESRQGDGFSLVLMASPPKVLVAAPAVERSEILREIAELTPPCATSDLSATVAAVRQVLDTASRENPRLSRHEVYFLTDLQRVGWTPPQKGQALADFRRQSVALSEKAAIVVIDVGQPTAENLAVTSLRSLDPVAVASREIRFEAMIHNFGRQNKNRQPAELWIDGRRMDQKYVDVPAGGEALVGFAYRFDTAGDRAIEVRTPGDAMETDNVRCLSLPVRQAIRVLCIDGRPSGEAFRGAADYLVAALAPEGAASGQSPVHVEKAAESAIQERDLTPYDCIFICNVAQFTTSESRLLKAYLQNGGNVVFFLGDRIMPDRYNRELFGEDAKGESHAKNDSPEERAGQGRAVERLFPVKIGPLVRRPQYRIDPHEFRHPIVKAFRGRGETALLTTPVFQYYKLEVPKDAAVRTVLGLTDGDPLLVEGAVYRGRVAVFATSAEVAWSGLPLWPSFVPLVQELLSYSIAGKAKQRNLTVGEPIVLAAPAAAADAPVVIQTPDGRGANLALKLRGETSTLEFSETGRNGFYSVKVGSPLNRVESFAVNVDAKESDLAQLSAEELRDEVWPGVGFMRQTTWQNAAEPIAAALARQPGMQVELLYCVFVILLVETYLAYRFGRR
jgi:hypothetical protein